MADGDKEEILLAILNKTIRVIESPAKVIRSFAFMGCEGLTAASFPNCGVVSGSAFSGCRALSDISLPACLRVAGSAFSNCELLESVNLPVCTAVYASAFGGCKSLRRVDLPEGEAIGSNTFASCSLLSEVSAPLLRSMSGVGHFRSCSALERAIYPSLSGMVPSAAFSGCRNLSDVRLGAISAFSRAAFNECYNLVSLDLTRCSSVPSVYYDAFSRTPLVGYSTSTSSTPHIYVPESLYEAFLSASYWSSMASYITSVPAE